MICAGKVAADDAPPLYGIAKPHDVPSKFKDRPFPCARLLIAPITRVYFLFCTYPEGSDMGFRYDDGSTDQWKIQSTSESCAVLPLIILLHRGHLEIERKSFIGSVAPRISPCRLHSSSPEARVPPSDQRK